MTRLPPRGMQHSLVPAAALCRTAMRAFCNIPANCRESLDLRGLAMLQLRTWVVVVLAALASAAVDASENWERFRGPNGTGVSAAKNLPVEFGPTSHVKWKTPLPPGHSSPVFTDTHIFLTAHSAEKEAYKLFVIALDRKTGRQLWQHEVPRVQPGRRENVNGPASPSPVTDGSNVYFFFQDFGLISYTAAGKERWRMPLGPFTMFYGFGASPILEDGKLILAVDQDADPYLLAVDARSGKQLWRVARPHVISGYSTPTIWRPKTGPAQILVPESFQLTAYSIVDGKQLWWGARPRLRDEIGREHRQRHAVYQRLGLRSEPGGHTDPDGGLRRRPQALRRQRRRIDRPGRDDARHQGSYGAHAEARSRLRCLRRQSRRQARCKRLAGVPRHAGGRKRPDGHQARRLRRHDEHGGEMEIPPAGAAGTVNRTV